MHRKIWALSLAFSALFSMVIFPISMALAQLGDAAVADSEETAAPRAPLRLGIVAVPKRVKDAQTALAIQTLFRTEIRRLVGGHLILPVEGGDPADLQQVRKWVDDGTIMMRGNRFTDAAGYYEESEKVLDSYNEVPDRRLWARVYKGRAITAIMGGDKQVAADFTRRSLMFWPGQSDVSWGFNIETSRLLRSVKVEWDTTPHGGVDIVTEPGESEVFIDGRSRGFSLGSSKAPFSEEQLQIGIHHVLIVKDGFVAQNHWVEVQAEKNTQLKVKLVPIQARGEYFKAIKRFTRGFPSPKKATKALEAIAGAHGGLDTLLVVKVSSVNRMFKVAGFIYSVDRSVATAVNEELRQDAFLMGNIKGIVRNVFGLEFSQISESDPLEPPTVRNVDVGGVEGEGGEDLFIAGGGEVFDEERKSREPSIYSKWWFWAGAAVLTGGIVTTVVLLASEDADEKGPTGTINLNFNTSSQSEF